MEEVKSIIGVFIVFGFWIGFIAYVAYKGAFCLRDFIRFLKS